MDAEKSATREYLLESWLELHGAIDTHPELRRLLFDPVTGLPTTPLLFPRITTLLAERGEVSLLCLDVVRYSRIEEIYGWQVFDEVMREIARTLEGITGASMRDSDIVAGLMVSGSAFVIVLSPPRDTESANEQHVRDLARRLEARVRESLEASLPCALFSKFGCYAGWATIRADETVRVEQLVRDGLIRALETAAAGQEREADGRTARLTGILERGDVTTLVHPVYRLGDLGIVGYEVLSRGPAGEFERPDGLFKAAYDADLVLRLERLCRRQAIRSAGGLPAGRLLFLNIEPEAIADPELRDVVFTALLSDIELAPERIVLEMTERAAARDFASFRSMVEYVRALGFKIAVDDAGAGGASLQVLAEVRPDWLKLDMPLVRGIDRDDVRGQLVRGVVSYAEHVGARLVAQGIETVGELDALRGLGVGYGQGYLFTRPVEPFPADKDVTPVFTD